jgi:hypothetical protein
MISTVQIVIGITIIILLTGFIFLPRMLLLIFSLSIIIVIGIVYYVFNLKKSASENKTTNIVNSNIWQTINKNNTYSFPELCNTKKYLTTIPNINKVSLAISGGGSRSFTCMMGYFRALNKLGYKNKPQYVSTVSGGSWFYGLYSYCQSNSEFANSDYDTYSVLLGESCSLKPDSSGNLTIEPSALTLQELKEKNKNNKLYFGNIFTTENLTQYMIDGLLSLDFGIDLIWNYAIGRLILEPYGLNDEVPVAINSKHSEDLSKLNPDISYPLYLPDNMPFWICNTTLMLYDNIQYPYTVVPLTPLYSGMVNKVGSDNIMGGYLLDNYAFGNSSFEDGTILEDSESSCSVTNITLTQKGNIRQLSDMIGTSSTAYAKMFYDTLEINKELKDLLPLDSKELIPKYNIWGKNDSSVNNLFSVEANLGDGVFSDNSGIISLLARGVKHIIAFANVETRLEDYNIKYDSTIRNLFNATDNSSTNILNDSQVFNTSDYVNTILPQFQTTNNSGGPTFARAQLEVLKNSEYGVTGNYVVDILIILLQPASRFINQLKDEIKNEITTIPTDVASKPGLFNYFPNYKTLFQNVNFGGITLTLEQINLLSTYTEWCLLQPELKSHIQEMYNY